jgi:hypothetical protein
MSKPYQNADHQPVLVQPQPMPNIDPTPHTLYVGQKMIRLAGGKEGRKEGRKDVIVPCDCGMVKLVNGFSTASRNFNQRITSLVDLYTRAATRRIITVAYRNRRVVYCSKSSQKKKKAKKGTHAAMLPSTS